MDAPLHDDDPDAIEVLAVPTGAVTVRNLSAEEYAATYATGEPHHIPDDVLAQAADDAARITEQRTGGA